MLILINLFLMFLLMWDTFLFKAGLLGILCQKLREQFLAILLYFFATVGSRAYLFVCKIIFFGTFFDVFDANFFIMYLCLVRVE